MKFKWVEHPSDIGFRAYGKDLGEAFENAALALFEVMTDTGRVEAREEVGVELEAEDEQALLYDWLDRLLYFRDAEGLLFSRFRAEVGEEGGRWKLRGRAWGERFDPKKHEERTAVKAVTYHLMEVGKEGDRAFVQVVVDI
ncbi:MAG: archease [Candidatus Hadarchaeales archaeon]